MAVKVEDEKKCNQDQPKSMPSPKLIKSQCHLLHEVESLVLPPSQIEALRSWLDCQAISTPDGWVEACIDWLVEEHGRTECLRFSPDRWQTAVYEQWLHTDLQLLACPILPEVVAARDLENSEDTLLLEGELCLQVSGLVNIGESYYGQLRKIEGNMGNDMPDLEQEHSDLSTDTTAFDFPASQMSANIRKQDNAPLGAQTLALHLTDGVTTIKAVEIGTKNICALQGLNPRDHFRPGTKVRLRGPLKLRKGVLTLPCGSISMPSHSVHSNCTILGGEVDYLLSDSLYHQSELIQKQLMLKLCLPIDQQMPKWFPGQRQIHVMPETTLIETQQSSRQTFESQPLISHWGAPPVQIPVPYPQQLAPRANYVPNPFEDDELLLAGVMEDFETSVAPAQVSRSVPHSLPVTSTIPVQSTSGSAHSPGVNDFLELESQIDAEILESALHDIDFSPLIPTNSQPDILLPPPPPHPAPPPHHQKSTIAIGSYTNLECSPIVETYKASVPQSHSTSTLKSGLERPLFGLQRLQSRSHDPCETKLLLGRSPESLQSKVPCLQPSTSSYTHKEDKTPLFGQHGITFQTSQAQRHPGAEHFQESIKPIFPLPKNVRRTTNPAKLSKRSAMDIRTLFQQSSKSSTSTSFLSPISSLNDVQRRPFCYLQDVYNEMQKHPGNSATYTVRGILVSIQSRLEHHKGEKWSLNVRLADGSATVDADVDDSLLREMIGIAALEGEAMRQMGRQGDEAQKTRLKDIIQRFQARLCHLSGLFDIVLPDKVSGASSKPRITSYRSLDAQYLAELKKRVLEDR